MTTHNFEAETGRILELLTHSIYSNKEIFLRELISNASDAIDKARLKSLTDVNFLGDDREFKITVEADKENGIITITDNGIGMTKEELISHLGTIAKSGTKEFLEKLQKAKEDGEHNLIGQFGVGFYSSFMVSDKVEVESKSALDKKAHKWISDGKSGFDIEEIPLTPFIKGEENQNTPLDKEQKSQNASFDKEEQNQSIPLDKEGKKQDTSFDKGEQNQSIPLDKEGQNQNTPLDKGGQGGIFRGTKITLFIDEANKELLEDWKLKELIKKYSNYVQVPIMMRKYDSRTEEEKKKEPKVMDFEQVNETKPIWKKDKKDIKKEEYKEFYQNISYDWNDPLFTIHNNVEGMVSYKSILFAPKEVNMYKNLSDPNLEYGPKLYVQNVMILENAKELIPVWLRFISGVVETNDLPLNISREMLQANTSLDKIKKGLTKKVLTEFGKILKDNKEDYTKFWLNYGKVLKEGIHYEWDLKEEIAEVALWNSLKEGKLVSLEEYLGNILEDKKHKAKDDCKCGEKCECGGKHNHDEEKPLSQGDETSSECECGEECKCEHNHEDEKKEHSGKTIYYIISKSENEAKASPYLAQFKEKGIDVLILTDAIDSFLVQGFNEYKGAKFVSITSNDIELEKETKKEKEEKEKKSKDLKPLFDLIKSTIGDEKIEEVVLNDKLGTALGALKTPKSGIDPQLEKMMKAMGQQIPVQKRILELNPKNGIVDLMKIEFDKDIKSEKLQDLINYAYWQAILLEGGEIENIGEFVEVMNKLVK